MIISLNAIKQIYKQTGAADFLPDDINKVAEKVGAQLGEIEEIIDLGKKYEGIVAAKVISCEKHPGADRLKLCTIDIGGNSTVVKGDKDGLVQVVCGAPNVRVGMLAAWIPPGATVPATYDKEPLVLEAREIRGVKSYGMLASAHELGLSDDHDGILEIDKEAKPGDLFAKLYKLDDFIIDIENKMFTHRPDCFGLLGIARELAGIYHKSFVSPEWYAEKAQSSKLKTQSDELPLEVVNEIPELVPRFCMATVSDVKVATSPVWLQAALSKAGIKAVNNIVDLTNFYMYYTGQPLHAYDYDKVAKLSGKNAQIKVRKAKQGEKLKLLNGKEITAENGDIMIATDKVPVGIGGVIGGADTEVDASTKNIILECANFDSYTIRRTSMHHGIFTEAVTRFTKGQSPHQNLAVLTKVVGDTVTFTGGKISGTTFDLKGRLTGNKTIETSPEFINSRLGLKLTSEQISSILKNVEFIVDSSKDELEITAPFWRTDIEIPEDIVEEVGRLYGYDHLPLNLPKKTMTASVVSDELRLKQELRGKLAALGANEVLNYSFVRSELLENAGQDKNDSYKIKNALSPDLQYYRQALTPSLLEKVHPNIKAGFSNFALFELGKVHINNKTTGGLPDEFGRLSLVTASKSKRVAAFYTAKKYLVELLAGLDVDESELSFEPLGTKKDASTTYYEPGRAANIKLNNEPIGYIGEYTKKAASGLKLPEFCAGFEIELATLLNLNAVASSYKPLSRYPSISLDITLQTDSSTSFAEVKNALVESIESSAPEDLSVKIESLDVFSKDSNHKNTSFRIVATSYQRTLTTDTLNIILDKASDHLNKTIKASRV